MANPKKSMLQGSLLLRRLDHGRRFHRGSDLVESGPSARATDRWTRRSTQPQQGRDAQAEQQHSDQQDAADHEQSRLHPHRHAATLVATVVAMPRVGRSRRSRRGTRPWRTPRRWIALLARRRHFEDLAAAAALELPAGHVIRAGVFALTRGAHKFDCHETIVSRGPRQQQGWCEPALYVSSTRLSVARSRSTQDMSSASFASVISGVRNSVKITSLPEPLATTRSGT
jgi:hypothetical protein